VDFFDAHIRSDTRSSDDLKNLAYFGTERVLTAAHPIRPFRHSDDLLGYFEGLVTSEVERIRRAGLLPCVALGLLADSRPKRSHYEVWEELPIMLEMPEVVAVGEIGAWADEPDEWELFERQVRLARQADLPILVATPNELKVNMTYKMMARLDKMAFPPELAMFNHLDERLVQTVAEEGFLAGVSVGPYHLDPRVAAPMVAAAVEGLGSAEKIVMNSALRAGGGDILSLPKVAVMLADAGVPAAEVERLVYGNAMRVFVR
jgi:predicted metal-dependent TIM-barrel fold hydrolase